MRNISLKRTAISFALVASFLLVALVSLSRGQNDSSIVKPSGRVQHKKNSCANQTVEGAYSFTGNGAFIAGNESGAPAGPYTTVGFITFDGAGHFNVTYEVETFNGQFMNDPPFTGTYQVNSDCTFTVTNEFGDNLGGIIVDDGTELDFIATDPGVVLNFIAKKN